MCYNITKIRNIFNLAPYSYYFEYHYYIYNYNIRIHIRQQYAGIYTTIYYKIAIKFDEKILYHNLLERIL